MSDPPITKWISGARERDEGSEQALWNYYFQQVVRLARTRMFGLQGIVYDEEDAAISALGSLFRGLREERFPRLHDRHNLWRILVVITTRKLRAQWRRETAGRRHQERVELREGKVGINEIIDNDPTAEFVAEMMDETESLLEKLGENTLRRIVLMRLDGMTNNEIASRLGRTTRTVERKMERIRRIWGIADDE